MVSLRQRLLNASLDTELLAKIYKMQANEMGFEDFHMFQRYIQLDFAKYKDNASDPPPMFVGEINMEDPSIDRWAADLSAFIFCLFKKNIDFFFYKDSYQIACCL